MYDILYPMPIKDPQKRTKSQRRYYLKNKAKIDEQRRTRDRKIQQRTREFVKRYKLKKGCAHCGYKGFYKALDLHHVETKGEKHETVSHLVAKIRSKNLTVLKDEMRKCIVLCATCHREEHGRLEGEYE